MRNSPPYRRRPLHSTIPNRQTQQETSDSEDVLDSDLDSPKPRNRRLSSENSISPPKPQKNSSVSSENTNHKKLIVFGIGITIFMFLIGYMFIVKGNDKNEKCTFLRLREKYPHKNNLWQTISAGISSVVNKKMKFIVYLLLHQDNDVERNMVKEIAQYASKCFDTHKQPIIMGNDIFNSNEAIKDEGYPINMFIEKAKKSNVIVIPDLNMIRTASAKALHFICDTYSPIPSDKTILFLTLTINSTINGRPCDIAKATLDDLWGSKLPTHIYEPLYTRITDQVLLLANN